MPQTRCNVWNQIKADMARRRIHTMQCKEAACLGAAIPAGKAPGIVDTVEDACEKRVGIDNILKANAENKETYISTPARRLALDGK